MCFYLKKKKSIALISLHYFCFPLVDPSEIPNIPLKLHRSQQLLSSPLSSPAALLSEAVKRRKDAAQQHRCNV